MPSDWTQPPEMQPCQGTRTFAHPRFLANSQFFFDVGSSIVVCSDHKKGTEYKPKPMRNQQFHRCAHMIHPPPATTAKGSSMVKYTGAILYRAADGVRKLQVRVGDRGRGLFAASWFKKGDSGLFAASWFKKGDTITMVAGVLMDTQNSNVAQHAEIYQWSKTQAFVIEPAEGALGIFANTAASDGANNARFFCNRQTEPNYAHPRGAHHFDWRRNSCTLR